MQPGGADRICRKQCRRTRGIDHTYTAHQASTATLTCFRWARMDEVAASARTRLSLPGSGAQRLPGRRPGSWPTRRIEMKYVLRVFDPGGSVQTVRLDSDSSGAATAIARSRGLRVVSIRADSAREGRRLSWSKVRNVKFNVELFARELAALLDAGVGVVDALRTLGSNERREASAQV